MAIEVLEQQHDLEQVRALHGHTRIDTTQIYATIVFQILAKAGLRPGEAFALKPGDIDFRARTLQVERAVNLGRLKPTKTYECRTVDLTPDLLRVLHRHVLGLKEEALRRGWGEPAWLFPNDANRPYDKWKAGDAFRRTLKRAGLPHFRLYDLRHTYASLLLAAGAPITYVSAQLGHANPTTTSLCEVDPEPGAAVGGGAGPRRLGRRPRIWNQNLEPNGAERPGRRASDRKTW